MCGFARKSSLDAARRRVVSPSLVRGPGRGHNAGLAIRSWKSWRARANRVEAGLHAGSLHEGARYFRRPEELRPGCRVELLSGGSQIYPAMLEAIGGAAKSVHLETFTLADDRTGRRFQAALIEAARRGVEVRVIYDAVGSLGLGEEFVGELREAGVELVEFRPIAPWRQRWGLNQRDHQKILVVDAQLAFIGGTNISDEYDPDGENWHDVHTRVRGPAVGDLARLFRRTWLRGGGARDDDLVEDPERLSEDEGGTVAVAAIDSYGLRNRGRLHRDYRYAIGQARDSVDIMNAYFIPERNLRRALRRATLRGVRVRVIVPGQTDVAVVRYASCFLYTRLLKDGVEIHEYQGPMMHAKCGVIDATWSTVGSYNLDSRSMLHNLEAAVLCLAPCLGTELQAEFERLLGSCRRVDLREWSNRGWWTRVLEWVSYRFRYWL